MKLLELTEAGGCGCKLDPQILKSILGYNIESNNSYGGFNNFDDCAIHRLNKEESIISTLDFFTPIVNSPYDYGQIAAANALSDIYAMGGIPSFALNILGVPKKLNPKIIREIIQGGRDKCKEVGVAVLGGHTIVNPQPIFGLSLTASIKNHQIKANSMAKAGDHIYITKPLGIGILSTALKRNLLKPEHYEILIKTASFLNKIGGNLSKENLVSTMTDITGFGLAGHLSEIGIASNVSIEIDFNAIPFFDFIHEYLEKQVITSGGIRNKRNYQKYVNRESKFLDALLYDPQTNGGLLCFVPSTKVESFLNSCQEKETMIKPIKIGEVLNNSNNPILNFKN